MSRLTLCLALSFVPTLAIAAEPAAKPISQYVTIQQMHAECNRLRAANKLPPLALDESLCLSSQRWACRMADGNFMGHGGGENCVAMGQRTPILALRAWYNSSGHRFWLLSNTKRAGWGCQRSLGGTYYWSATFRQ